MQALMNGDNARVAASQYSFADGYEARSYRHTDRTVRLSKGA